MVRFAAASSAKPVGGKLLAVQSTKLTCKVTSWLTRMSSSSDHANNVARQPESNFEKDVVTSELPSSTIRPICLREKRLMLSKLGTPSATPHPSCLS